MPQCVLLASFRFKKIAENQDGTRAVAQSIGSDRGERSIRSILINISSDIKSKSMSIPQENLRNVFDRFKTVSFFLQ